MLSLPQVRAKKKKKNPSPFVQNPEITLLSPLILSLGVHFYAQAFLPWASFVACVAAVSPGRDSLAPEGRVHPV